MSAAADTIPHIPVLNRPLIAAVSPVSGVWLEGTFGNGGYTRELLEAGADPNVGDRDGKTPLYWAAWEGSPGPIVALLKGGADHGAADSEGVTPLLVALERNNLAAVELLRGE